jgi:two-component system sensor histidine kinase MtrB
VYAEVDPRRVERIVRNLVANAVDHGESRPVDIRLGCDENSVAVIVRDRGLGLRPGEAALVFNRFWRADSSRARRSGGTGLGLSISVEDARLHGGWLQAWGEPGQGAVFRLTLPRRIGEKLDGSPLPLIAASVPALPRTRTPARDGQGANGTENGAALSDNGAGEAGAAGVGDDQVAAVDAVDSP